jgi:hypothetical protein
MPLSPAVDTASSSSDVERGVASAGSRPRPAPVTTSTSASALGLALGRLRIRVDGLAKRTTDRPTEVVSGVLVGGTPRRVRLEIEGQTIEPMRAGRAFTAAVELAAGVNRVRVIATDEHGTESEEVVTILYQPRGSSDIVLSSPRDGLMLTADEPPLIIVQGQVSGERRSSVWIVANGERIASPVVDGRFRGVLPVLAPTMRVRVELDDDDRHSETVTVHAAAAVPSVGLLLSDWPRELATTAEVTALWRPDPAVLDRTASPLSVPGVVLEERGVARGFFYLRHARPGVYTFVVKSPAPTPQTVRPTLYLGGPAAVRQLPPLRLDGAGTTVIARVLVPQGVLWEQDDWFSGRSVNGDTLTKFRFPDGVSWTERLGDGSR